MQISTTFDIANFLQKNRNSTKYIQLWFKIIKTTNWNNFDEMSKTFPNLEKKGKTTFFRVGKDSYRIKTYVDFESNQITIRNIEFNAGYNGQKK